MKSTQRCGPRWRYSWEAPCLAVPRTAFPPFLLRFLLLWRFSGGTIMPISDRRLPYACPRGAGAANRGFVRPKSERRESYLRRFLWQRGRGKHDPRKGHKPTSKISKRIGSPSGFIVHSPVAWRNKTEIDVLAVRFPKNAEPERGVSAAEELVAADGVIDIVIGEVKSRGRQLQFNEALRQSCDTSRTPGGSTPVPLRTCWSIWAWKILKQRAQRHERARLNAHVIPMSPFWVQLTGANDYAPPATSAIA